MSQTNDLSGQAYIVKIGSKVVPIRFLRPVKSVKTVADDRTRKESGQMNSSTNSAAGDKNHVCSIS